MRGHGMERRQDGAPLRFGRRRLLVGTGAAAAAAAVVGAVGTMGVARPASATALRQAKPVPSPIPGGIDTGPPVGFIHWFLPGPVNASTPFAKIPGFGLDVEPSTITHFKGFTAFAILSGQAEDSDGTVYNVEYDVRVMQGEYIAAGGSRQQGVFGFF